MIDLIKYLLCTGLGIGAGYILARRQLQTKFYDDFQKEVDLVREDYDLRFRKKSEELKGVVVSSSAMVATLDYTKQIKEFVRDWPEVIDEDELKMAYRTYVVWLEETNSFDDQLRRGSFDEIFAKYRDEKRLEESRKPLPAPVPVEAVLTGPAKQAMTDYQGVSTKKVEEPKPENPRVDIPEKKSPTLERITIQEFDDEDTARFRLSVIYYVGDDVLTDQSGEKKLDDELRRDVIGEDILKELRESEENSVVVLNRVADSAFEIIRDNSISEISE